MQKSVDAPTETSTIARGALPEIIVADSTLADQMRKQEYDLMRGGLKKAGLKESTLEKLDAINGIATNAGKFLVSALDLSHKMVVYTTAQLLEQMEEIKSQYLDDVTLRHEYKIEWQKCYNELADLVGRGFDRTLAGTQAMAKIMAAQKEKTKGRKKAGFVPLGEEDDNAAED